MEWKQILGKIAPTVAVALGGPLAGTVIQGLGEALGVSDPTKEKIQSAIESGNLTGEQISAIRMKELELKQEEQERGFKYSELEFKDRDSARRASVDGGTIKPLFVLSVVLLVLTLGTEIAVLFGAYESSVPQMLIGRILGLMDSISMMVLAFWYGTSSGSVRKTDLLATQPTK